MYLSLSGTILILSGLSGHSSLTFPRPVFTFNQYALPARYRWFTVVSQNSYCDIKGLGFLIKATVPSACTGSPSMSNDSIGASAKEDEIS